MSKNDFIKRWPEWSGVAAAFSVVMGIVLFSHPDKEAGSERQNDPNVACMIDDISVECVDLYSKAVAQAGRFDDPARFFIHGGGDEAMRKNDEIQAVIESNGLLTCFAVKADSTGRITDPVDTLNSDNYRPNYTARDVPNHLAVIYDDAARGLYSFGDKPEEVTAFIYAKDAEACRSFPNSWSVDNLVYNNL